MIHKSRFSPSQIKYIFERDGGICIYCGSPALEIDHVVPVAMGGKARHNNGVCCCKKCNSKKKHHLDEYLTRGIFWLMQCGEDVSWIDKIDNL